MKIKPDSQFIKEIEIRKFGKIGDKIYIKVTWKNGNIRTRTLDYFDFIKLFRYELTG